MRVMDGWSRPFALLLAVGLLLPAAAQESAIKYRLSYRKHPDQQWIFYADLRDKEKAERIADELRKIGYQPRLETVSATNPAPSKPPPPAPPPPPAGFSNPKPEPTVFDYSGRQYFQPPKVVGSTERPGYRSSVFSVGNGPISGWGWGWGGWGWGMANNPLRDPQLNTTGPAEPVFRTGIDIQGQVYHPTGAP